MPGFRLTVHRDTPSSSAISWKLEAPRAIATTAKATRVSSDDFAGLFVFRPHSIAFAMRSVLRTSRFSRLMICCDSDCVACISHLKNKKRPTELMQAARQTFLDSGFPVCIDCVTSLASTCGHLCNPRKLCQQMLRIISITTPMTKQPIMIRVVVVCPVTGCYRVEYRRLDPSAQGLVSMTAEQLAAG